MAGSSRRAAWAAVAVGAALTTLVGCSDGDSDVARFTADFSTVDDADGLFNQSLMTAVELCGAEEPPLRVQWTFSKKDTENPIAQQYIKDNYPSFIDCSTIQGTGTQVPGPSQPAAGPAQAQQGDGSGGAATTSAP
jgi:hypothetical protein